MTNLKPEPYPIRKLKGDLAESIFSTMLLETRQFQIFPYGYEKVVPYLAQHKFNIKQENIFIDRISCAPDFILVSSNNSEVLPVDVKYRTNLNPKFIVEDAKNTVDCWGNAYYFIVTLEKFYFDQCEAIVTKNGFPKELSYDIVSQSKQSYYSSLVKVSIGELSDFTTQIQTY